MSIGDFGYVYFARPVGTAGVYKIGATNNLKARIKRYRVPMEYVAYGWFEDYFEVEGWYHLILAKYSFSGEWHAIPIDVLIKYTKDLGLEVVCPVK